MSKLLKYETQSFSVKRSSSRVNFDAITSVHPSRLLCTSYADYFQVYKYGIRNWLYPFLISCSPFDWIWVASFIMAKLMKTDYTHSAFVNVFRANVIKIENSTRDYPLRHLEISDLVKRLITKREDKPASKCVSLFIEDM